MSRKTQEDQSTWQMPSIYAFAGEYGPYKVKGFDPIEDTLVWLCHSGEPNDDDESENDQLQKQRRHPMYPLAGPIQDLLLSNNHQKGDSRFSTVLIVDICDMFESLEDYEEALASEEESLELTKKTGKKLLRLFQKLLLHRVAVVARGRLCPLLLKLYKAVEAIDKTYQLEENNTIAELWLLHPELSTKYVNTHLTVGAASAPGTKSNAAPSRKKKKGGAAASKKKKGGANGSASAAAATTHPVELNLVHTSSESNKISALKPFFPNLGTEILTESKTIHDWVSLVAHRREAAAAEEQPYDPERCSDLGKMLFCASMNVEMNKFSKQYERNCTDATTDLLAIQQIESTGDNGDATTGGVDWSSCERHVGGLLLRGNRCVLVRSLEKEWEGMRIPSVVPHPHESPTEAAIRSVAEFAEVDESEIEALPNVLPVAIYAPDGRPIMVELHPLYAASAPPGYDEPDYEAYADEEDEDDLYDWYTFPRALGRLDSASGQALQCLALTLLQAAGVGLVPSKWGGVFGQELQLKNGIA